MKVCPTCKAEFAGGEVFCPSDASRLTTPSKLPLPVTSGDPLIGRTLADRYRILRRIGEGGMGIVYEAEHVIIEKRVALKVLRSDFSSRPDVVERFRQEAKSASRIGHEHIIDISDFGETDTGQSYFVMEYLDGEDLANVLAREGTVRPGRAVEIVLQCAQALGAAHAKGIVHRDMKPENVFLVRRDDGKDFVKIVDFGIAKMNEIETAGAPGRKLTKTGMIFGTPEYMSPEQAAGKALDHRVDVYALGVILFECLTGRVPFTGESFMAVLSRHMFDEVPALAAANASVRVPAALEDVIRRAMAKSPDERFASMESLGEALREALTGRSGTVLGYGAAVPPNARRSAESETVTEPLRPTSEPPRRSRRTLGIALGGGLVAVAFGAWAISAAMPDDVPVRQVAIGEPTKVEPPPTGAVPARALDLPSNAGTDAPPETPPPPPRVVHVEVVSRPSGAKVIVEGRGEVCAATPCTFATAPGDPVEITAIRGDSFASRAFAPSEDTRIDLRLKARRRTSPEAVAPPPAKPPASRSTSGTSDLKIPEIFR